MIVAVLCSGVPAEARLWTLTSGEQLEAEYVNEAFDAVSVQCEGKIIKIQLDKLSEADRSYVELQNPPELKIEFIHRSDQLVGYFKATPYLPRVIPPILIQYTFGAQVQQTSSRPYSHPLTVEYFAVGRQLQDRDKYILLERKSSVFKPSDENDQKLEFTGRAIRLISYEGRNERMGRDYAGYLVVVRDRRGEIVAHAESSNWLFSNRESLEKIPVGAFMDNTCVRVNPSGPKPRMY
jgi:hypothetical protein